MGEPNWLKYPIRTCQTLHHCRICEQQIQLEDVYRDGGYNRRAHLSCIDQLVDPLPCGHPRSARSTLKYRCDLYQSHECDEVHTAIICTECWEYGDDIPDDFDYEISREHS